MKRALAFVLVISFLLSATACSTGGRETGPVMRMQFTHKEFPSADGGTTVPDGGLITAQCVDGSRILIGVSGERAAFGSMDFDGNTELSPIFGGYDHVYAVCATEEGAAALAGGRDAGSLTILLYDAEKEFTSGIQLEEDYGGENMSFELMLCVGGRFVLMAPSCLIKINADGTEEGRIPQGEGQVFSSMCFYDGGIIVSRGHSRSPHSQICGLDIDSFELGEEREYPVKMILGLGVAEDGRLIINEGISNSVSYFDMASGNMTELFSWGTVDLYTPPDVKCVMWTQGGYAYFLPERNTVNIVEYELVQDERIELVLAKWGFSPNLAGLVNRFNTQNERYKITVANYDDGYKNIDHLRMEIIAGNPPDLYCLYDDDPLRGASSELLYEDLLPYMDADPGRGRETLVPTLLTALTRDTGAVYWMPYEFGIFTFIAPISLVGDRTSITMEEAERIARSNDLNVFDIAMEREWVLGMSCKILISRYIDPETGICDFENPDFIALLEKCNEHPPKLPDDLGELRTVLQDYWLTWFDNYQGLKHRGDDYCFVGVPATGGEGGVFMSGDLRFAISAQSENKDGAWEFIRFILSPENQQTVEQFPVVQQELDRKIDELVENVFVSSLGVEVDFNQSDADKLRGLIERTTAYEIDDKTITGIIQEEAAVYFAGERSASASARIIQDRLSKYVAERK